MQSPVAKPAAGTLADRGAMNIAQSLALRPGYDIAGRTAAT
jgi:hypothetical protein